MISPPPTLFEPQFNPDARIEARLLGRERQPLLLIDNALVNAPAMVDYAATLGQFARPPRGSMYPGLNAPLPPSYLPSLCRSLQGLLEEVFGFKDFSRLYCDGFFGLTTDGLEALSAMQRTPHYDSDSQSHLAMVYYLCAEPYGGTGFYRHQTSGFEFVDQTRAQAYADLAASEVKAKDDLPRGYVGDQTPFYDQIAAVGAVFNRLAVYRTTSLHCALLNGAETSADPRVGRLTANVFLGIP